MFKLRALSFALLASNVLGDGHLSNETMPDANMTETGSSTGSLPAVIAGKPELSTLLDAVGLAGLADFFNDNELTVFAPTNDALAALLDGNEQFLTPPYQAHLAHLLRFHAVAGSVYSDDLVDGMLVNTSTNEGTEEPIMINVGDGVTVMGESFNLSTVIEADIAAENGVVHVVDTVFLPTALTESLLTIAESIEGFENIGRLLSVSNAESILQAENRTIFAPGDTAFGNLDNAVFARVGANETLVEVILNNHVFDGIYPASSLYDGMVLTTIDGVDHTVEISENGRVTVAGAVVEQTDNVASNGIAHVIAEVLIPDGALDVEDDDDDDENETPPPTGSAGAVVSCLVAMVVALL